MDTFLFKMQSGEIAECTYSYTSGGTTGWVCRYLNRPERAEIMFSSADWRNFDEEANAVWYFDESVTSRALRQEMCDA